MLDHCSNNKNIFQAQWPDLKEAPIALELDAQGIILAASPEFCSISGYSQTELAGANLQILRPTVPGLEQSNEILTKIFNPKYWKGETLYQRKDGTQFCLDNIIFPVVNTFQEKTFLCVSYDITESKSIEASQIHTAKMKALAELSVGIAHEINNPLAIILGSVELLERFKENPEKFSQKVEAIKRSCERVAQIIRGLQKFSLSGDKQEYRIVSIDQISESALNIVKPKSEKFGIRLKFECSSQTQLLCSQADIEQALLNLLNNAIDAARESADKWVELTVFDRADQAIVRIVDSGPGIKSEGIARLFQPLYSTKGVGQGLGLGLAVAKGILEEHGASIALVSSASPTCFEIRFKKP